MPSDNPLTVGQLTNYIKRKFDADPYLSSSTLWVVGELTDFRLRKGHQYFALKDDGDANAKISTVMFRGSFQKLEFELENGQKLLARGRVSVYPPHGTYSMTIDHLEPVGVGSLQLQFDQMWKKLNQEGLFNQDHKKPIPPFPKKVALVTSQSGAVVHDLITTFRRRNPLVQLVIYPTRVQGETAAEEISRQIQRVDEAGDYDIAIVARGGGSREDLWPFNEEIVGRTIYEARVPVISSIGHETDTTIADLVADLRMPTPTAAAEAATAWPLADVMDQLASAQVTLRQLMHNRLRVANQQLDLICRQPALAHPERLLERPAMQLDQLTQAATQQIQGRVQAASQTLVGFERQLQAQAPGERLSRQRLALQTAQSQLQQSAEQLVNRQRQAFLQLTANLDALSPLKVLQRGYAYATKDDRVVKVADLAVGDQVDLYFDDGKAQVSVERVEKGE